jgi:transposase-like protein
MATARTNCPSCHSRAVVDRNDVLHHEDFDFYQCGSCQYLWHVPKDANGPASQSLLVDKKDEKQSQ